PEVERYFDFDQPWTTSLGEARATLAAALGVLGQTDAAAALYGPLKEWTGVSAYVLTGASSIPQLVSRVLGMAAAAGGLPDEAAGHFKAALAQARELGAKTELAEAGYWYAHFLAGCGRPGDREHVRRLLAEARAVWEGAGMPKHLERAHQLEAATGSD
ncbi:MAG TPA: hypothetical protein VFT91_10955, partial [Dehalococcoidia bacterium]|nr:hypothetical protein [Dehalococcoidia bacterium]